MTDKTTCVDGKDGVYLLILAATMQIYIIQNSPKISRIGIKSFSQKIRVVVNCLMQMPILQAVVIAIDLLGVFVVLRLKTSLKLRWEIHIVRIHRALLMGQDIKMANHGEIGRAHV